MRTSRIRRGERHGRADQGIRRRLGDVYGGPLGDAARGHGAGERPSHAGEPRRQGARRAGDRHLPTVHHADDRLAVGQHASALLAHQLQQGPGFEAGR